MILKWATRACCASRSGCSAFDTPSCTTLVADMFETMHAANGAGLAAPQIGIDLQLVIFGFGRNDALSPTRRRCPRRVLINPQITPLVASMEDGWEGCLSVPGAARRRVPRHARIRYSGFDPRGQRIEARGPRASTPRVVQARMRPTSRAMLYPMRMRDFSQFGYTSVFVPRTRPRLPTTEAFVKLRFPRGGPSARRRRRCVLCQEGRRVPARGMRQP
jgi:peptide deformylase